MDRFMWYTTGEGAVEDIKIQAGGVGLFDGEEKHSNFEVGTASLTPIRLIWVDSNDRTCRLSLLHSLVTRIDRQPRSLLNRTAKIIIHVVEGPSSTNKVRMIFKSGGDEMLYNKYSEMLRLKEWEKPASAQPSQVPAGGRGRPTSGSAGALGGISAVQRNLADQHNRSAQSINQAFEDLSKLMDTAGNMVQLSKRISEKLRARQGEISEDETIKFKSYLLSLGVSDPVTKSSIGSTSDYYRELAREMVTVLADPIKDCGGLMSLPDVYCRLNRARGLELISPEDLWNACTALNNMDAALRLSKFSSGVMVLQLAEFSMEATVDETDQLVTASGHMSAHDLAQMLNVSVVLSEQRLLAAEQAGVLCRDDSIEGHRFYPNQFLLMADGPVPMDTTPQKSLSSPKQSDGQPQTLDKTSQQKQESTQPST